MSQVVAGHNKVVADIIRLFGIDPKQTPCRGFELSCKVGSVVTVKVEMMPTLEQMQEIAKQLEPVAATAIVDVTPIGASEWREFVKVDVKRDEL